MSLSRREVIQLAITNQEVDDTPLGYLLAFRFALN